MEGRGIRLEVCGELGDFSILSDFGTCPLLLTLPTPKGGSRLFFPDKIISLAARGCCSPIREGAQACSRGRGKDPICHHPLSLCLREGEEHPSPQGSPPPPLSWPSSPFLPSPHITQPFSPYFHTFRPFASLKKLPGEGGKQENSSFRRAELQTLAVEERSRAASHPQPALQHRWPKASVTSPVKRGLEQRGSWGLKCRVLADRRLCWISTVHAPNGNLSLSLASILAVCFPSGRLPCSAESPRDFLPVSAASLSPTLTGASRRVESFGGSQGVLGKSSTTVNLTLTLTLKLTLDLTLTLLLPL